MNLDSLMGLDCAITICNLKGEIVYMNSKSQEVFAKWGGGNLVGKSLFSCHLPSSIATIKRLMKEGKSNTYTIEKGGIRKLIHQTPWYDDGKVTGMVELSIVLPDDMPHHKRD